MNIHVAERQMVPHISEADISIMSAFADTALRPRHIRPAPDLTLLQRIYPPHGAVFASPQAKILSEAAAVAKNLSEGMPLPRVAAGNETVHGFGIGHLLHNILRKQLARGAACAEEILTDVHDLAMERDPDRTMSRHHFLSLLRASGHVDRTVSDKSLKPAGTNPCLRAIGALIAEDQGVPFDLIVSSSRKSDVVKARFRAIYVLRTVCGHSLSLIGQQMGDRDHTTILNSINKVMMTLETDRDVRASILETCEKADTIGVRQGRAILARQA